MLINNNQPVSFSLKDQNIWFTSDTHFGHPKIIEYACRPFKDVREMDEVMIENWNKRVKPDDIIFHLGDFGYCSSSRIRELLTTLTGKKFLIIGNHDWRIFKRGHSQHFQLITQQMYIKIDGRHVYLNHFPFLCFTGTYKSPEEATWQIFGHVHSGDRNVNSKDNERLPYLWPTQYDAGVDNNDFSPICWSDICEKINEKTRNS